MKVLYKFVPIGIKENICDSLLGKKEVKYTVFLNNFVHENAFSTVVVIEKKKLNIAGITGFKSTLIHHISTLSRLCFQTKRIFSEEMIKYNLYESKMKFQNVDRLH